MLLWIFRVQLWVLKSIEGLSSAVSACANALQWQEALVLLQPQKPVP